MRKFSEIGRKRWIRALILSLLYLLFLVWVKSWMGLIVLPFIVDALTTRIIKWDWWRQIENKLLYQIMGWIDALVFALIAVYFVNLFLFQNYAIPTSSLEKSLLVGDHLYVSKVAYGPRKPMTPLTMPLTQNQFPGGGKSYLEKPQWPYERIKGFRKISLNEIVVFNYPGGDTILGNPQYMSADFYGKIIYPLGKSLASLAGRVPASMDSLSLLEERSLYDFYYNLGRRYIERNESQFGKVSHRPVDRRENYVKRCVGLPGQTFEIRNGIIYVDGVMNRQPKGAQTNYNVTLLHPIPDKLRSQLQLSLEDLPAADNRPGLHVFPLTVQAAEVLSSHKKIAQDITPVRYSNDEWLFPLNKNTGWTIDDYGPVWIPAKGSTVDLTLDNLPFYERIIGVYEGHDIEVTAAGDIIIDGEIATSYTFGMDYYWMMGDNRQNSADSRFWGYVPEDHIVGRPVFVWLSLDKDKNWGQKGKIRWNRVFRSVKSYN